MSKARIHAGSLGGALFHLAWPMALAGQLNTLVPLLATLWLGRLGGPTALSAAAAVDPVLATVGWWVIGVITVGEGSLVARAVGGGRPTTRIVWSAAALVLLATGTVALVGVAASRPLSAWLTHGLGDPDAARRYLVAALLAFPFLGLGEILVQAAAAAGWTRLGLLRRIGEVSLYAALAPALFLAGLGVAGPPAASGVAAALLVTTLLATLRRRRADLHLDPLPPGEPRLDRGLWARIVAIGVPSELGRAAQFVARLLLVRVAMRDGQLATAGFGVAMALVNFPAFFTHALASANAIIVGQNLGAGREARAFAAVRLSAAVAVCVGLLSFALLSIPAPLAHILSPDPAVVAAASRMLLRARWGLLALGIAQLLGFASVAVGETRLAGSAFLIAELCGAGLAWVLPGPGLEAAGTGLAVAWSLRALLLVVLFRWSFVRPARAIARRTPDQAPP